jgi:TonB family protein
MNYLPNIILTNLFLVLIWISYELFLGRTRFFQANRFFLAGGSVLAVVLPWLPWQINFRIPLETILGLPLVPLSEPVVNSSLSTGSSDIVLIPDPLNWFKILYFSVALLLLVVSAAQFARLLFWAKTRPIVKWNNHKVVLLNQSWSAFSFFRTIFYPEPFEPGTKVTRTILEHEKVHASQLHSIDNLILLVIRILFFYNPVIYLIASKLRLTHEYIADQATAGYNKADYSHTLISHQFMVPRLILMHSFNTKSFLQRRLIMLAKTKQNHLTGWKYLLVAPLLGGMILLSGWSASAQDQAKKTKEEIAKAAVLKELTKAGFSKSEINEVLLRIDGKSAVPLEPTVKDIQPGQKIEPEYKLPLGENVFTQVEEMPEFQGGDITKFREWAQSSIKYPVKALQKKISGTVYASFLVNSKGEVTNVQIERGVDPSLDEEVIKVIKSSPAWKAGKQKGKPVNVSFVLPLKFILN